MKIFFTFFLSLCASAALYAAPYVVKDYGNLLQMPGFNSSLLEMHFKLYAGYVKNTNDLMSSLDALSQDGKSGSYEYGALKRRLGWEFDGMRLHELYFENLGGNGKPNASSPLYKALVAQFGSYENWKKDFIATGMMRGIDWAILYFDPQMGKLVNVWINEHDVGHLATGSPILIMDVFEHAYMPQFGLDRAKYIDVLFTNLNWEAPAQRYNAMMSAKK